MLFALERPDKEIKDSYVCMNTGSWYLNTREFVTNTVNLHSNSCEVTMNTGGLHSRTCEFIMHMLIFQMARFPLLFQANYIG